MRLFFKLGVAPDPKQPPIDLEANSESDEPSAARWFGFGLDLKTVIAAAGLIIGGFAQHVATESRITKVETSAEQTRQDLQRLQVELRRTYTRAEAEALARQLAAQNENAARDRQQIYTLLFQLGRSGRFN